MGNEEPRGSLFFVRTGKSATTSTAGQPKPRVAVFVDGSNLHHRLQDCGWPTDVDVAGFAQRLAGARRVTAIYYYNVPPPRTHRPEQIAAQRRYYARIEARGAVVFRMGHLQERKIGGKSIFEEKGVDVTLTVDMLSGAHQNLFDTAILVSSDGDFAPLVGEVRRRGKRVEYVYFPRTKRSRALQQVCNISRECRLAWVVQFES
ncbi:MAG: NYN domain-containing protein [Chloroflexota bacterium]|nr:NYN domain-containing protein [Chloroflexota bacterium]